MEHTEQSEVMEHTEQSEVMEHEETSEQFNNEMINLSDIEEEDKLVEKLKYDSNFVVVPIYDPNLKDGKRTKYLMFCAFNKRTKNRGYFLVGYLNNSKWYNYWNLDQDWDYIFQHNLGCMECCGTLLRSINRWGIDSFRFGRGAEFDTKDEATEFLDNHVMGFTNAIFEGRIDYELYNNFLDVENETEKKMRDCVVEETKKRERNYEPRDKSIKIEIIETGEAKVFSSKTECLQFIGCSSKTFASFLKGKSKKLNKLYKILRLKGKQYVQPRPQPKPQIEDEEIEEVIKTPQYNIR